MSRRREDQDGFATVKIKRPRTNPLGYPTTEELERRQKPDSLSEIRLAYPRPQHVTPDEAYDHAETLAALNANKMLEILEQAGKNVEVIPILDVVSRRVESHDDDIRLWKKIGKALGATMLAGVVSFVVFVYKRGYEDATKESRIQYLERMIERQNEKIETLERQRYQLTNPGGLK